MHSVDRNNQMLFHASVSDSKDDAAKDEAEATKDEAKRTSGAGLCASTWDGD